MTRVLLATVVHWQDTLQFPSQCQVYRNKGSSTRTAIMEERSSPLRVQTSVSLPEIPGKAKDIVFKLDMHRRSSDCAYSSIRLQLNNADICVVPCRTDRAVLAVNGFAADGNMFVKTVKQRLEVRCQVLLWWVAVDLEGSTVVSSCPCERHAPPCHCPSDTNDVVCKAILPILRVQHSGRH